MKTATQEEIMKKWDPVLKSMGMTGSQLENLSLAENQSNQILPIDMKVASKTISNDLIFASQEEIDQVKNRVQSENRDGKIESIVEGGEFIEKKLEDDEEYKNLMKKGVTPISAPTGQLFYLDYKYDDNKTHKKLKNKKNGNNI